MSHDPTLGAPAGGCDLAAVMAAFPGYEIWRETTGEGSATWPGLSASAHTRARSLPLTSGIQRNGGDLRF